MHKKKIIGLLSEDNNNLIINTEEVGYYLSTVDFQKLMTLLWEWRGPDLEYFRKTLIIANFGAKIIYKIQSFLIFFSLLQSKNIKFKRDCLAIWWDYLEVWSKNGPKINGSNFDKIHAGVLTPRVTQVHATVFTIMTAHSSTS